MKSVIISGICGKAGKEVYETAMENGLSVVCGIDKSCGKNFDCPVYKNFETTYERADVVIDFSSPDAQTSLLEFCVRTHTPLVIATTGQSEKQIEKIREAASEIPILKLSNTSRSVNLFISLVGKFAQYLKDYDIEIIETHHKAKKDAPSGTSIRIAKEIKNKRNTADEIHIHAVRGGEVAGEHSVLFLGVNDSITLTHSAFSKKLFADGAIKAARFICDKPNGLYNENDFVK